MAIDTGTLAESVGRLAQRDLAGVDVIPALTEVVSACVDIFEVDGCGILLADEQNVPRYVAASDGPGRILETAESDTGQGPCTEAFVNGRLVACTDLIAEERWPALAAIVAPQGIRAVMGVPIRMSGTVVGTIDVYRFTPHEWDESERTALSRYGDVIGASLAAALAAHRADTLAGQLQYALEYRVAVERAIGFLMARDGIDSVTAFNRLRRAARNSRRKIGEVAEELLATAQPSASA